MLTVFGDELIQPDWRESVVCIGTFDGVHLGHRELLRTAAELARARECPSVAVTFDRHPLATLAPERCPAPIANLAENLEGIAACGISACAVLRFDRSLSELSADRFFDEILLGRLRAAQVVLGHDFAFGQGREGNEEWLRARIGTVVIPPLVVHGARVSSTAVRAAVTEGRMEDAQTFLGRPFSIGGVVVAGEKLGRKLGYPTLNLARLGPTILPPDGVYAGWCQVNGRRYATAASIGMRPTVGGRVRTVEAYLLDYPGESAYGWAVRLELTHRLREERTFADLEALTTQMALDVELARDLTLGAEAKR